MKKIPSNNNLSQLKDVFNMKSDITSKIIYSTFMQQMSDEFLENAPYNFISHIQHNMNNDNTILDSISFGNNTNEVIFGFTISNYYHMKEVLFCVFLYYIWYRLLYINHTTYKYIQTKIGVFIDLESVQKKMNLILFILFFIFNRNIENAV